MSLWLSNIQYFIWLAYIAAVIPLHYQFGASQPLIPFRFCFATLHLKNWRKKNGV